MEAERLTWHKRQWESMINRSEREIGRYICDRLAFLAFESDPVLAAWKQHRVEDGASFLAPMSMEDREVDGWLWYEDLHPGLDWDMFLTWKNTGSVFEGLSEQGQESFLQWITGCQDYYDLGVVFITGNKELVDKVISKEAIREAIYDFLHALALQFGLDCRYVETGQVAPSVIKLEWSV